MPDDVTAGTLLAASCLYAGFQLTVRLVVYPQMTAVPASAFADYERAHQHRITPLVGVLFAGLAVALLLALLDEGLPRAATVPAAALFAVVLAATAFGAVRQHTVLARGFDAAAHRRLLAWDTVRCTAAVLQAALALWLTLAG